jgi:hypothetical protein
MLRKRAPNPSFPWHRAHLFIFLAVGCPAQRVFRRTLVSCLRCAFQNRILHLNANDRFAFFFDNDLYFLDSSICGIVCRGESSDERISSCAFLGWEKPRYWQQSKTFWTGFAIGFFGLLVLPEELPGAMAETNFHYGRPPGAFDQARRITLPRAGRSRRRLVAAATRRGHAA